MEEQVQKCEGCRWLGKSFCWHPRFDDQDDGFMGKRFRKEEGNDHVPVWCPGKVEILKVKEKL